MKIMCTACFEALRYVIDRCHEMGHTFVIANSIPTEKNLIKQYADEAYMVDASDIKAVAALVKEKNIDGIFVTASDAHLRFYCDICKEADLNAYCTKEQAEAISDKILFKDYCAKHGLNVIPEYTMDDVAEGKIKYPVMVKVPDNSGGSQGMTLVHEPEQLMPAIEFAKKVSPTESVVIEHYIDGDEFVINYFFVDGKPFVLYTKDYCKNIVDGMVMRDNAMISPSKYEKLFYEKADAKLREMFADIGMTNGIIFLQCFVEDGELYFFEGGCRAGGADEYLLWNDYYGIDYLKCMMHFALHHNYGVENIEDILLNTKQEHIYSVLNVLVGAGTMTKVSGIPELKQMPEALAVTQLRKIGDKIAAEGTNGQIALRVMVRADSPEHYLSTIDKIYSIFHVEDENGNEMVMPHIDLGHWVL